MILTKLTVSGFGKLKGYSTTFDKEINTFVFENGWGKTTLSDFIYAMFYGLAQTTKKKLTDNLRKKYQPWDGGTFGGSLDFIHDEIGENSIVSLMSQYEPRYDAIKHPEINRKITPLEYKRVVSHALKLNMTNCFTQDLSSADSKYTPKF